MELVKLAVGSPNGLQKSKLQSRVEESVPPKQKNRLPMPYIVALQEHHPLLKALSPQAEKINGDTSMVYLGRAALRKKAMQQVHKKHRE